MQYDLAIAPTHEPCDASDLTDWIQRRSEASFRRLVDRHHSMVQATCRRRLGRGAEIDDVVQAVFIVLSQHAARVRDLAKLGPWLHGVTLNVIAHHLRSAARRSAHTERVMTEPALPEAEASWESTCVHLDEAIAHLSDQAKSAVIGHYLEGRSHAEVGIALDISAEAARKRAAAGLDDLRRWFKRRGLVIAASALVAGLQAELTATEPAIAAQCTNAVIHATASRHATTLAQSVSLPALAVNLTLMAIVIGGVLSLTVAIGMLPGWQAAHPEATPATIPPLGNPAAAASVFDVRVDVCYRRDYLCEVLADLRRRTGAEIGNPPALDRTFYVTYEQQGVTLREVLMHLARAGGLQLELKPECAVFWKTVDDAALAELTGQVHSPQRDERIDALVALGKLADARIYPLLIAGLSDPDAAVATQALRALESHPLVMQETPVPAAVVVRWVGHPVFGRYATQVIRQARLELAVPLLLGRLRTASHAQTDALIDAVGFPQEGPGVDFLLQRVAQGGAFDAECLYGLARTHSDRVVDTIAGAPTTAMEGQSFTVIDGRVRSDHAYPSAIVYGALGQIPGAQVTAILTDLFHRMPDVARQNRMAADAMAEALACHASPEVIAAMVAGLHETAVSKQCQAARFFHWRREPGALPDLLASEPPLGDHTASATWADAFPQALATARDPQATRRLIDLLASPERAVRREVMRNLGRTRDAMVLAPLVDACTDADGDTRRAALASLAMLRMDAASDAIVDIARAGDGDRQDDALKALSGKDDPLAKHLPWSLVTMAATGKSGRAWLGNVAFYHAYSYWEDDPRYQQVVGGLRAESGDGLREQAYQALFAAASIAELARIAVHGGSIEERIQATSQLASRDDLRAIEPLVLLLTDPEAKIRYRAICRLGLLAGSEIIPTLKPYITDPNEDIRYAVAFAYEKQASPTAIPLLRGMCDPSIEPSEAVRSQARSALDAIGGREAQDIVHEFSAPVESHPAVKDGDVIIIGPAPGPAN